MIPGASAPCLSTLVIPFPGVDDPATIPPLSVWVWFPIHPIWFPILWPLSTRPPPLGDLVPGIVQTSFPGTEILTPHPFPIGLQRGTSRAPFRAGDTVTFSLAHLHILEASVFCLHKEAISYVWFCGPNMRPQEGSHGLTVCTRVTYMHDLDPSLIQQNSI